MRQVRGCSRYRIRCRRRWFWRSEETPETYDSNGIFVQKGSRRWCRARNVCWGISASRAAISIEPFGNHAMTMTRRDFLSAAAGLAVTPTLGAQALSAPLPREADIVVIGAGAAGIAAARRIQAANRKVIVVEASGQIGGRCLTDTATFDVPFDRGARWLHNPDTNPMIRLGRDAGLDIYPAPLGQKIRIGRRNARAGETEEFLAALVRANR